MVNIHTGLNTNMTIKNRKTKFDTIRTKKEHTHTPKCLATKIGSQIWVLR